MTPETSRGKTEHAATDRRDATRDEAAERPYEPPTLRVLGGAADLTRDPSSHFPVFAHHSSS